MRSLKLLVVLAVAGCGDQGRVNWDNVGIIALGTFVFVGLLIDSKCTVEDPC